MLIQCVKDYVKEYREINLSRHRSAHLQAQRNVWNPSPKGWFKLNVDGAVDTRGGKKGVRAVIRDWNGVFQCAIAMPNPCLVSVLATEIYTLKVSIEFAIDARWLPFIVESDSQNAIRLITQDDTCFVPEGNFVEEVRHLTVDHHLVLIAIPREVNGAAHRAARYGLHEQGFNFWTYMGPPWLTEILNSEIVFA